MLRTITVCYALLLAVVLVMADSGMLRGLMSWLHFVPYADKVCHFLLVGGLSFLLTATLGWHHPRYRYRLAAMTIVAVCAIGCVEELSQILLTTRRFDTRDMLCNVAGAWCLGLSALLLPVQQTSLRCAAGEPTVSG